MAAEREDLPGVTNDGAHIEPVSPKRSRVKLVKIFKHVKFATPSKEWWRGRESDEGTYTAHCTASWRSNKRSCGRLTEFESRDILDCPTFRGRLPSHSSLHFLALRQVYHLYAQSPLVDDIFVFVLIFDFGFVIVAFCC